LWEKRFERSYGFWRELVDEAVARYLDCGIWDLGFARVKCRESPEDLLAFSWKGRGLCPSCGEERAAELAAFRQEEVGEEVGHAQWVFTIPKMLRVYLRLPFRCLDDPHQSYLYRGAMRPLDARVPQA